MTDYEHHGCDVDPCDLCRARELLRRVCDDRTDGTLRVLQAEQVSWVKHNFGDRPAWQPLLGLMEEIGELTEATGGNQHITELVRVLGRLAHADLKSFQGIRTNEDHDAKAKDAVADIVIFLADYCSARGWDMEDIVQSTWDQVKRRDWKRDRAKGVGVLCEHGNDYCTCQVGMCSSRNSQDGVPFEAGV